MNKSVLVIGGGIAGIQVAIDLANMDFKVHLVEKTSSIGGRMAQLDKTFPTNDCSMCILSPKMIECYRHENIHLMVYSEIMKVDGYLGNFNVKVLKKPTFVDWNKCVGCGNCVERCPKKVPNEFNMFLDKRKAIYLRFPQAVPKKVVIDPKNCLYLNKGKCRNCEKICQAKAIDFSQKEEIVDLNVAAIVIATGYEIYDVSHVKEYGYGRIANVITAMEFERLISASGPTKGELSRPSDGKIPRRIAFILCVGSRDVRSNLFCSSVCCMYATKEAILAKEHCKNLEAFIFYTDLRAVGKNFQSYVIRARDEYGVNFIRGRPGKIIENESNRGIIIFYEDTTTRVFQKMEVDLVVVCPALIPSTDKLYRKLGVEVDNHGFIHIPDRFFHPFDTNIPGIFACGFCQNPQDIPNSVIQASGTAARIREVVVGGWSR